MMKFNNKFHKNDKVIIFTQKHYAILHGNACTDYQLGARPLAMLKLVNNYYLIDCIIELKNDNNVMKK